MKDYSYRIGRQLQFEYRTGFPLTKIGIEKEEICTFLLTSLIYSD